MVAFSSSSGTFCIPHSLTLKSLIPHSHSSFISLPPFLCPSILLAGSFGRSRGALVLQVGCLELWPQENKDVAHTHTHTHKHTHTHTHACLHTHTTHWFTYIGAFRHTVSILLKLNYFTLLLTKIMISRVPNFSCLSEFCVAGKDINSNGMCKNCNI